MKAGLSRWVFWAATQSSFRQIQEGVLLDDEMCSMYTVVQDAAIVVAIVSRKKNCERR